MDRAGLIHSLGDLAALYQIYGLGFFVLSALYAALISAGVAFLPLARTPWLPPFTYWLIPVAIGGMMALRRRRADGATEIP